MFEAVETIPSREIKAYRDFVGISVTLGYNAVNPSLRPLHLLSGIPPIIPFSRWKMQVLGSHPTDTSLWDPDKATVNQIRVYRNYMLGNHFLGHFFFHLDNTNAWINPIAFQAYMNTVHSSVNEYCTQNSTPFSSHAPSCAGSSVSSRTLSRDNSMFSPIGLHPSSRASFVPASRAPSSRAPSPFNSGVIVISDSNSDNFPATVSTASIDPKIEPGPASALSIYPTAPSHRNGCKGKEKAAMSKIQLTRQEALDEIIQISSIPSTWTVSRIPAAYLVDFSNALDSLKVGNRTLTIDWFIRTEVNLPDTLVCFIHFEVTSTSKAQTDDPNFSSPTYPTNNTCIFGTSPDVPEFQRDANINGTQFGPAADDDDLGNLPTLPMPSSPFPHKSPAISADTEIRASKKKRPRAPKVNEAPIIEGSRPQTRSH
ncbi:hypothetical protein DFH08DRAFT_808993 [Mycena albidolilacea]|uniref:Uncharacterized protein n=1 Tax=Mycena albidolilacea TaxID=1033008 RepID=A0AAD7A0R0_9AGAR|nr:hypothetical protein DFH08DRAFT_808993 [Mycena albidolilacea]